MTTFLLIRHGSHDLLGKALAGRALGVRLNAQGLKEAQELAHWLGGRKIDALYVSERERSRETIEPLAICVSLSPKMSAGIDEIDFGEWTGRTFSELSSDPEWSTWNSRRSAAQPPGGEKIGAVQERVVHEMERLAGLHRGETVGLVSHCDVIKAALARYLTLSLDALETFDIEPASVSVVTLGEGWSKVKLVNGGREFFSG